MYSAPGPLGSSECLDDACCIWKFIADDMARSFKAPFGQCNELARQAIRMGFHDAGTWSKTEGGGGADGSIILAGEWMRDENRGIEGIAHVMQGWYARWHRHGAGMADLIQMAANVAVVSCPLGPRVRSFVGRKDSAVPVPEGRLPRVTDDGDALVALFDDKTISLPELIALVGAHGVSIQRFVDPERAGSPQDTTPGIWDGAFYEETISDDPPPEIFTFHSDRELANYPGAQGVWTAFSHDQQEWNEVRTLTPNPLLPNTNPLLRRTPRPTSASASSASRTSTTCRSAPGCCRCRSTRRRRCRCHISQGIWAETEMETKTETETVTEMEVESNVYLTNNESWSAMVCVVGKRSQELMPICRFEFHSQDPTRQTDRETDKPTGHNTQDSRFGSLKTSRKKTNKTTLPNNQTPSPSILQQNPSPHRHGRIPARKHQLPMAPPNLLA